MDFFDPNAHPSQAFAIGSPGHLVLMVMLFGLLALMVFHRRALHRLRASPAFMRGTAGAVLAVELTADLLKFVYPCGQAFERIPLHLCATLKVVLTVMVLVGRVDLVKNVSIIAIGSGFISFVNLNLGGAGFGNFAFWHYLVGHLYLFALPLFLFLTGEFRCELKHHARAMLGLAAWSLVIFFVNWAFDANYMYTGPHNDTVVPFIPARLMIWPLNYVSYIGVGLVLLSAIYGLLKGFQARLDCAAQGVG